MTDQNDDKMTDLELARQVRELDLEIQPDRDLWVGVQRKILDNPRKSAREKQFWMPYAVAASLLVAVSALLLNLFQLQQVDTVQGRMAGINQLEDEYVKARNPLVDEFTRVNHSLDSETKTELYRNLKIMAAAREKLEAEVRANPENTRLRELLIKLHEQELALLRQDFTRPSRSL
jgi:hypothetical protein